MTPDATEKNDATTASQTIERATYGQDATRETTGGHDAATIATPCHDIAPVAPAGRVVLLAADPDEITLAYMTGIIVGLIMAIILIVKFRD